MAEEIHVTNRLDGPPATLRARPVTTEAAEPSLGELFKELAEESSTLIRQEMALAKLEMRQNLKRLAKDMAYLALGGGILLVAMLVLTAFFVAGLGEILGDEYWLGALIVGAVYALIGGILMMRGKSGLKHDDLKPDQTIRSLQEDKRWVQSEVQQVKRELTS